MTLDPGGDPLIPTGAPRGLYEGTDHLLMPRFSFAWTPCSGGLGIRGGFGLFYDKPEGNVIFSQVNLPPFVPSVAQVENGNLANPLGRHGGGAGAARHDQRDRSELGPRRQHELQHQRAARAAEGLLRRGDLRWQTRAQPALVAGHQHPDVRGSCARTRAAGGAARDDQLPAAVQGLLVDPQRRSEADSDYNGLQLYPNKRRGDINFTVGYTLSKVDRPTPAASATIRGGT